MQNASSVCEGGGQALHSADAARRILSRARYRRADHEAIQIALVGCGGSGGWLAPALARIAAEHPGIELLFIDPDTVEEKNLARQNFCAAEVGRNKAEALATRYSQAWGVDIAAIPERIQRASRHLSLYSTKAWTLLIGCVDNAAARVALCDLVRGHPRQVGWLDCGNTETSGQIVFGTVTSADALRTSFAARGLCTALPVATLVYPDLLKPRLEETGAGRAALSCADIALRNRQIAVVNKQVAVLAEWYVLALVAGQLDRFQTTFELDRGVTHTSWVSPGEVAEAVRLGEAWLTRGVAQEVQVQRGV